MYFNANRDDKIELETSIIQEGNIESFGILNYAYAIHEKFKSTQGIDLDSKIDKDYIKLLGGGFKFFKIMNLEKWFKISKQLKESGNKNIYNHILEYQLVNKFPHELKNYKKVQFKWNASHDEIILNCQLQSVNENSVAYFNDVELNLTKHDLAIINSSGTKMQDAVVDLFLTEYTPGFNNKSGMLGFLYLIDYLDAANLEAVLDVMLPMMSKNPLVIGKHIEIILEKSDVEEDKKEVIRDFFVNKNIDELKDGFFHNNELTPKETDEYYTEDLSGLSHKEAREKNLAIDTLEKIKKDKQNKYEEYLNNEDKDNYDDLYEQSENKINRVSPERYEDFLKNFEKSISSAILLPKKNTSSSMHSWFNADDIKKIDVRDKKEKDLLQKILENAFKPKLELTDDKIEQIEELKKELPNFAEVIDYLVSQIKLNIFHKGKMSFKPVLLLGDPGLGKTYVAQEISKILQTGFEFIDFASTSAAFVIKGGGKQWKDAEEGKILKLMISSPTINPIVLYDEVDKNATNKNYPPEVVLYQLFEPLNARNFEDEYLGFKFDASTILNICTANTVDTLTAPLLSRMDVFTIEKLNKEQTRYLINKMYKKTISNYNLFESELSEEIILSMENLVPRQIDTAIHKIIAKNIEKLSMKDISKHQTGERISLKYIDFKPQKTEKIIGF